MQQDGVGFSTGWINFEHSNNQKGSAIYLDRPSAIGRSIANKRTRRGVLEIEITASLSNETERMV